MHLSPHQSRRIKFTGTTDQQINVNSSTLHRVYIHTNNISVLAVNSQFHTSGLKVQSDQSVRIENCSFYGTFSNIALEFINIEHVTVEQTVFHGIESKHPAIKCNNSHMEVTDTEFHNNSYNTSLYEDKGMIYMYKCDVTFTDITVSENNFYSNDWFAGCIYAWDSNLTIAVSTFIDNILSDNYLLDSWSNDDVRTNITNCRFINNTVGGLAGMGSPGHKTVENTEITGNKSPTVLIAFGLGSSSLRNVTMWNNQGPFIYTLETTLLISSCMIYSNSFTASDGVYIEVSTVNISDTEFADNQAPHGACLIIRESTLNISNCNFSSNRASMTSGGVVYVRDEDYFLNKKKSIVEFFFCNFKANSAQTEGGVIYTERGGHDVSFNNCHFVNNLAQQGGAISLTGRSSLQVNDCDFVNNSAQQGGAIFLTHRSSLQVLNSTFVDNCCLGDGGGIKAHYHCTLNVSNSSFYGNIAKGSSGGAVFIENQCQITTESSDFWNNTCASGGGAIMIINHSNLTDKGSQFNLNTASHLG